ncbi:MAG: Crp/Fnr family transcriptional regulator [Pseudobdellovibrionaceae bacterium]
MSEEVGTSDSIIKETYKSGDFIFFEGDIESHFYIIETGKVQIFTKNKVGKRVDICTIADGESFGEFALLDRKPRSASAQALTEVTLVKVSEDGYEQLLNDLPVWAMSMMKSFIWRLKNMNQLIKDSEQFLKK